MHLISILSEFCSNCCDNYIVVKGRESGINDSLQEVKLMQSRRARGIPELGSICNVTSAVEKSKPNIPYEVARMTKLSRPTHTSIGSFISVVLRDRL